MAEAAIKLEQVELPIPFIRRFERPDIDRHAAWFIPRMLKTYPHLTDRSIQTWLFNILDSNEFMFLFQETGIALAQYVQYGLRAEGIVEEQFVWVADPKDDVQVAQAAHFYPHFYEWAKRKSLTTVVVEENSDVPHELVKEKLGRRLFERKLIYARVQ